MNYPITLAGFEGQTIEIQSAGLLSGPKLLVNGQPAPKGQKRGQMLLRRNDGAEAVATWKPQLLSLDVPQLVVEGKTVHVVEPLKWYEWVWSALPILLIFMGGALGALAGLIGFMVNTKIFRSKANGVLKFVFAAGVSALTAVVYVVVATVLLSAIGG